MNRKEQEQAIEAFVWSYDKDRWDWFYRGYEAALKIMKGKPIYTSEEGECLSTKEW